MDANDAPTIRQLFAEFLEATPGQSACSRRNYRQRLRHFLARYGDYTAGRIQRRHVNRWHEYLRGQGFRDATMAGYRQAIRAFFNWLRAEGHVARNPTDHLRIGSYIPVGVKLPAEADVARITQMVSAWIDERGRARRELLDGRAAESTPLLLRAYPERSQVRDAAIWLLARGCGPRSQELCNLRLSAVSQALEHGPDEQGIYRVASTGKTGSTIMRFGEQTAAALRAWLEARPGESSDYCFVSVRPCADGSYRPLNRSSLAKVMMRLAEEAGASRPIYTHALRHRVGHLTTRQHGPKVAALLLNHRDAATAATAIAFYHHPDESDVGRAVAMLS